VVYLVGNELSTRNYDAKASQVSHASLHGARKNPIQTVFVIAIFWGRQRWPSPTLNMFLEFGVAKGAKN
jgi:hypothetical protein